MKKLSIFSLFCFMLCLALLCSCIDQQIFFDTSSSDPERSSSKTSSLGAGFGPVSSKTGTGDSAKHGVFRYKDVIKVSFKDSSSSTTLPYCLILPEDYDRTKEYPLLLYLHGAGERGNDNESHLNNMMDDLYSFCGEWMDTAIVVCPQCPSTGWWNLSFSEGEPTGELGAAIKLVERIEQTYSVDSDRLYVMGLSMGGYGTWQVLQQFGNKFAAGVPICGWGDTSYAESLAKIPIWIYHGTADTSVSFAESERMYQAIVAAGGNKIRFTRLEGVGHNAWEWASYDREMIEWLFSQSLSDR